MATRRDFLRGAAVGGGAAAIWPLGQPRARAQVRSVRARLEAMRDRLGPLGWTTLLASATGGALDFEADDLMAELAKPVTVNRNVHGLSDFARSGVRGIEAGKPAASLLYHLVASPNVVDDGDGSALRGFPTLAEIEAVEDAIYAARNVALGDLLADAGDAPMAVVVFALQYRQAVDTVHGRHADLVFSRTGISRMGTVEPLYDARARTFAPLVDDDPFAFRPLPQRFAAFLAVRKTGERDAHGPMEWVEADEEAGLIGDDERGFWIPVHKLFDGDECLTDGPVSVRLDGGFINEKLARFHRHLQIQGFPTDWTGDHLGQAPFVMRDDLIAGLSDDPTHGSGLVTPRPAAFVNRARYRDDWLGFTVPRGWTNEPGVLYFSSGQILNVGPDETPTYEAGGAQETDRTGPEYISLRHRLLPDGSIDNLNDRPDMWEVLRQGGYRAQHYIDFSGEGWITAEVSGLDTRGLAPSRPAVCLIAPPDFFPLVSQRELMDWWRTDVPEEVRDALWAIPPYSLAGRRFSGNITLPVGFSIRETDTTAIVGTAPLDEGGRAERAGPPRYSGLPDHSPGYFDPGWDASQGIFYRDESEPLARFLQNYGLGTPFVEDVKLCAALGSYWPAIAPDSARNFTPLKSAPGFLYPWPSIVPLTDEETGIAPVGGRLVPWDGVPGPRIVETPQGRRVSYADINRVDYIVLPGTMTAALLARVDAAETKRRVMAMETVYWALGIRDPAFVEEFGDSEETTPVIEILKAKAAWSAVSFRVAGEADQADLRAIGDLHPGFEPMTPTYRFHMYRPGEQFPDPDDLKRVLLSIEEEAVVYVSNGVAVVRRGDGDWRLDDSLPSG